jgi:hypothetical protein
VILAISIRKLFFTLPIKWEKFETSVLSDCSVVLAWQTADEADVAQYVVERSSDGRNYQDIATIAANGNSFSYHDNEPLQGTAKVIYRILAVDIDGKKTYSSVNAVQLCGQKQQIKIYPTITTNYFVISGSYPQQVKELTVEVIDAAGKKIMMRQVAAINGAQALFFDKRPASGSYFVVIRNEETSEILHTQKITAGH